MGDLNSDTVVNEEESPRDAEQSKVNFLNFLSSIQTLESYQDFIRSESLNFVCDWCHFPQDESKVSVLAHSETFVCPCEIDLRFSEDHCKEALCVKDLIDLVDEIGTRPNLDENSWPVVRKFGKRDSKCKYNDKMFVSLANWLSRLRQSFLQPKMAANTNNSSSRGYYDDELSQCSGSIQSEETLAAGWRGEASDSGYPFSVSLGEIPLYQIEPTLQLNKKSGNHQANESSSRKRRSESKKAKRSPESSCPPHVYSVIRKITPQDKNHFLCRPAIGSDDNFIEIRRQRDVTGLVDNLCPAQQFVGGCDSRDANSCGVTAHQGPFNIGSSKCKAGSPIRRGHDSMSLGTYSASPCGPFPLFSSEPYVYQPLLKIKGGCTYAKQLQSRRSNRYASRFLTESYNKGASQHPATCTRHHVACASALLTSQSFRSHKTHHGWPCFQHVARRVPMFRLDANRTNNALSPTSSRGASCSSSMQEVSSGHPGVRIARVLGDGRCLFRSLVTGMHISLQNSPRSRDGSLVCDRCESKERRRSDRLRARVVQYMKDNAHLYAELDTDVINADQPRKDKYKKFKDRLADMSKNSSYPGEMELDAASKVLKRQIAVVNRDLNIIIVYGEIRFPLSQPLIVRYTEFEENVGHFDAVIPLCTNHSDNYSSYNDGDHYDRYKNNTRQSGRRDASCSNSESQCMEGSSNSQERMDVFEYQDLNVCNHNHKTRKAPRRKPPRRSTNYATHRRKHPRKSRRGHKSVASSSHKLAKSKSCKSKSQADVANNSGFFGMLKYYCVPGLPGAKEDEYTEKIEKSNKRKRVSESPSSCAPRKKIRAKSSPKKKSAKKQKLVGRPRSMGIRGYQQTGPSQRSCFVCHRDFARRDAKTWLQCCKCFGEAHRLCAVRYSIQPPKGTWFLCRRCNKKWVKK